MGLKPILTIVLHCLASSGSPKGDRSWPVVELALSLCSATLRNGDPLWASDLAGRLPVAAREKRTTGADTGADAEWTIGPANVELPRAAYPRGSRSNTEGLRGSSNVLRFRGVRA